ncbi:hypothetical protein B7C72_000726 [Salmonella enterica subsp. enterica serovar Havana]|nr:hypothetical protein [Salmonella enterica]EDT0728915.1 hypothetical protein [Salmonella enterica subsp. enterica serovar Havana]
MQAHLNRALFYTSSFKLPRRWLRSLTPVTYLYTLQGDSFSCRLDATRMILCILFFAIITVKNISNSFLNIPITVYF